MSDTNYVSKMSIKTMKCDPKATKNSATPIPIARIYGTVDDSKVIDSDKTGKPSIQFFGTFEGVNLQTGEVFESSKLFLPRIVEDVLETAIHPSNGEKRSNIAFAFELSTGAGESPVGYVFSAKNLRKLQENDPLAELRAELNASHPVVKSAMPAKPASTTAAKKSTKK